MAPIIAAKFFPSFDYPLDCYRSFRKKRILGNHKTIRGLLAGTGTAEAIFLLQQATMFAWPALSAYALYDIQTAPWYLGFLFGIGAIGGDALKSFFKRQLSINPGKPWYICDQTDWIIGTLVVVRPYLALSAVETLAVVFCAACLHIVFKIIGKFTGFQSVYV